VMRSMGMKLAVWFFAAQFMLILGAAGALAQAPAQIKIGATLPVTGGFSAEWGPRFLEFMMAWEKVVNEEGGVFVKQYNKKIPVKLIVYDDESSPDKSVELYEKLAAVDKVNFFLGPSSSPITLRASTVAEKLQIPMVIVEGVDEAIFSRGFRWSVGVQRLARTWPIPFFEMVVQSNNKKLSDYHTVGIVASDTPHTKDVGDGAAEVAKKNGFQVVASELVPFKTMDFSAVMAKLKMANPDIVVLALWDPEQIAFIKQALETGYKPKQIYTRFLGRSTLTAVGASGVEGIVGATCNARKMWDSRIKKIYDQIKVDPYDLSWSTIKYEGLQSIIKAVEIAGTLDREKVMQVFWDPKTRIPSMWGPNQFYWDVKERGKTLGGFGTLHPFVAQVQGGKIVVTWYEKWADAPYKPGWNPK
jgi:branched-chain amino acid transport system substrate-binding protein